jgi:DNA-binding transcriptional regulator YdaS (Cro superfamily)
MTSAEALKAVLAMFDGSPTKLAAAIGGDIKRQNVEHWVSSGRVPPAQRPGVEHAAEGRVTAEDLSDDGVHWVRVSDKSWPGKRGRPAMDVAKAAL